MERKLKFLEWMSNTIKSVHYADTEGMDIATEKIIEPINLPLC